VLLVAALFALNGLDNGWRKPKTGSGGGSERTENLRELRVIAFNAAKCSFHEGGLSFASADTVRERLDRIATVIEAARADVACLSEVVMESAPAPGDQVEYLARCCEFPHFACGENYSFGLPFWRIRSGNAVLSRLPLRALENVQLAGGRPFWSPTNNRRALWFEIRINGNWLLCASIRNDSFDLANNLRQVDEILSYAGARPALLAGDFNAAPGTPPMERLRATGRFSGLLAEPATYPAHAPTRRVDQVLVPASWTVVDQRVVDTGVSDHLAVVVTFALVP
jgi:endonuclease/exonuclease/phosphatase family metal-dependent hydrolase